MRTNVTYPNGMPLRSSEIMVPRSMDPVFHGVDTWYITYSPRRVTVLAKS